MLTVLKINTWWSRLPLTVDCLQQRRVACDDYSCEVDVACLVKKQCDGLHECSIAVEDNLFSGDLCPGLSNYLYFEYECVNTVKPYKRPCGTHGYNYSFIDVYNL